MSRVKGVVLHEYESCRMSECSMFCRQAFPADSGVLTLHKLTRGEIAIVSHGYKTHSGGLAGWWDDKLESGEKGEGKSGKEAAGAKQSARAEAEEEAETWCEDRRVLSGRGYHIQKV
jgi:hypothetical protein